MDTYVFANQKGGVGKTTVTLGIASALADRGARVLLIDLDPQASATKVLAVDAQDRCPTADELLETRNLVRAHYNGRLALAGVIVNRVERTVEHRAGLAEIESYFGPDVVWSPQLPKRTVLQDGARRGAPVTSIGTRAARELA